MHNGRNGIDTQGGKRGIGHAWLCHAQPGIEGTVFGLCPGNGITCPTAADAVRFLKEYEERLYQELLP